MPAGEDDYEGVSYADLVFEDVDWSEVGEHDPGRRSARKGSTEADVATEWASEACQDPNRWVRSAGSTSGLTVKVTGFSPSAGFVVTVIVAPKDHPPARRWWGGDRVGGETEGAADLRGGQMSKSVREKLARETVEAEARAEAEERGELPPLRGQRGRRPAADPAQVYAVRIPVSRLGELRALADDLGEPPTALIRRWVIERLDAAHKGRKPARRRPA